MSQQNKTEIVITALNQSQQAFRELKGQFAGLNKDLEGFKGRFPNFAMLFSGLAVSAIAATVVSEFRSIVDELDEISKASQRAGVSVEEFTKLKFAGTVSDASVEQITKLTGQLSAMIVEAKKGSKEMSGLFKAINVDISDNRRTFDILVDIAGVLSRMEEGYAKTALAKRLFGKSGAELLPFLNSLNEELGRVNVKVSAETAKSAEVFNDNWMRMTNNAKSFGYSMAADVLPALVLVTNQMEKLSRNDKVRFSVKTFLGGMFPELATLIELAKGEKKNTAPNFKGIAAGAYFGSGIIDQMNEPASPELVALLKLFEEQAKENAKRDKAKSAVAEAKRRLDDLKRELAEATKSGGLYEWAEMNEANQAIANFQPKLQAPDTGKPQKFSLGVDTAIKSLEQQEEEKRQLDDIAAKKREITEAEATYQLSLVDTAEAYHQISKAEAADKRLALTKELLTVQQQWLGTMDKAADPSAYLAQASAVEELRQKLLEVSKTAQANSNNIGAGFSEGLNNYTQTLPSLFESARDAGQGFLTDMEGGFKDLFGHGLRGEIEGFADFYKSTMNSMIDLAAEFMADMTMASLTNKAGGWGDLFSEIGSLFSSATANAKGNVYASPSLSQYSGQVVSKPTYFKFAYGAGVMGEGSDPEGIFPLARDKSGKLGVRAMLGGGNGPQQPPTVNIKVENKSGQDVGAEVKDMSLDLGQLNFTLLLKKLNASPSARQSLKTALG